VTQTLLDKHEIATADLTHLLIPHQANLRISKTW
jgi:3-oxoacyl-[acyl-carrier-protein] synthase-3